jgi:transcriptional regulator with XRE-family HTH domain
VAVQEAEIFGKRLRRFREERGVSQERLANSADLTTSFVSNLERGTTVPSLTTILRLAMALEISPGELLTDFTAPVLKRLFR